jgi:subtilisin family serine protease/subtilisin-like proprotein convertase family protein
MAETNFFWQGGRKVMVAKDASAITIEASSAAAAEAAAARANVDLQAVRPATPGLMRVDVAPAAREAAVDRLRAQHNVVHHVYRNATEPEASEYLITESFFLKFKPGTPESRINDYLARESLYVERQIDPTTLLVRVSDATGKNPIRAANAAMEEVDVEYAEPNLVRPLTRFFIPPDELFATQWHLHAPQAGPLLAAGAGIFAPEAWDITRGRRDVVIAVADDGFDMTHPDFVGPGKVVAQLNATLAGGGSNASIVWDGNVQPRAGDYHGTPCLGVAVAEATGRGVVGVAPGCALVAVRFPLQAMTDAHFITMFQKISTLADVVSCSWGVGPADAPMSSALRDAMTALAASGGRRGKGLVFCIAAGNNNCPVQDLSNTRIYRFRQGNIVRSYSGPIDRWVAAHPSAITVSASTSRKTRSAYSSWGRQVSVCAPSDNWDDLGQLQPPGLGIVTTDNEGAGPGADFTPGSRFTDVFGGTSSATPTVAGVCGLVLSANPGLTGAQVREILQRTADKDGLSFETDTPVNEPGQFDTQGFSLWFGHGKVNAAKAVKAALDQGDTTLLLDRSVAPESVIPEAGDPLQSFIDVSGAGRVVDLRVQVAITHTYIGDLRIDLIAPDGSAVTLHDHQGGSSENLRRTYSAANLPALRGFAGKPVEGRWTLRVVDDFRLDEGRLDRWRIVARVRNL